MQLKTVDGDVAKISARGEAPAAGLADFLVRDAPVRSVIFQPGARRVPSRSIRSRRS
jgi:hypothetical protein